MSKQQEIKLSPKIDMEALQALNDDLSDSEDDYGPEDETEKILQTIVDNVPELEPMAAAPVPVFLTPEERQERRDILSQINRYMEVFPQYMGEFDKKEFTHMGVFELEEVLERQRFIVGTRNSGVFLKTTFHGVMYGFECMGPLLKMELDGLSDNIMKNKETELLLNELSLEHEKLIYTSPLLRISMLIGMTMSQTHSANKCKRIIAEEERLDKPIEQELLDKYGEL